MRSLQRIQIVTSHRNGKRIKHRITSKKKVVKYLCEHFHSAKKEWGGVGHWSSHSERDINEDKYGSGNESSMKKLRLERLIAVQDQLMPLIKSLFGRAGVEWPAKPICSSTIIFRLGLFSIHVYTNWHVTASSRYSSAFEGCEAN